MREGGGFHLSYKELLAGNACEGGGGVFYTPTLTSATERQGQML